MKDAILELREKHPGWGAQTLRLEIAKDMRFAGLTIPSRARKVPRTGYCSISEGKEESSQV